MKTLSHYTTISGLIDILKTGHISGKEYKSNTKNFLYKYSLNTQDKPKELCLIRKPGDKNIDVTSIQPIDNIKIIFNIDNIINIRNIKKPKPINEYNTEDYLFIKEDLDDLVGRNIISENDANKVFKIIKKAAKDKSFKEYYKALSEVLPSLNSTTKKEIFDIIFKQVQHLRISHHPREFEERLDLSKNTIPVSSQYMKIILGNNIIREISEYKLDFLINRYRREYRKKEISREELDRRTEYLKNINRHKEEELKQLLLLIEEYKKKDPNLFEYKDFK